MNHASPSVGEPRTSFYTLPLELRERIYDAAFQGVSLAWLNTNIRPKLGVTLHFVYMYNGIHRHGNPPRWMLTCKQIHDEALVQWYRGASCSPCFCGPDGGKTKPVKLTAELCDIWRVKSLDTPVLNTQREAEGHHELWLSMPPTNNIPGGPSARSRNQSRDTQNTPLRIYVPRMSEHSVPYMVADSFHKYIEENKDLPAKQIKLSVSVPCHEFGGPMRPPFPVDLSYFELLGPRFDRVVFQVVCPSLDLGNIISRHSETYLMAQHEAVRVAKYLVSGNGSTGWKLRDFLLPFNIEDNESFGPAWCVEVTRQEKQQNGELCFEGLQKCLLIPSSSEDVSDDDADDNLEVDPEDQPEEEAEDDALVEVM